jgi:glycosyltransferase involved in cell wall biosynthesis
MTGSGPCRWVIVADTPFLPAHGGGEREHLGFVQAAAARGLIAALVLPADDDPKAVGRDDDLEGIRRLVAPAPVIVIPRKRALRAAAFRQPYVVASRPAPADLVDRVRVAAPDADAVVIFHYKSSGIGQRLAQGLGLPTVLRQHNLEGPYHHALAAAARFPKSWAMHGEAWRVDRDERRLEHANWLTGIADISASDARVRAARSAVPVAHVPSFALGGVDGSTRQPWSPPANPVVTFVGALDVATNQDAIRWFAEQVWPAVLTSVPGARWQVVGRRPTEDVRSLVMATPGAELHPDVVDPIEFLLASSAAVNPAVSGSGVNIKLVDYLSVGVPVVSTTRGMAGIGLRAEEDLLVGDTAPEFAAAVVRLLTSAAEANRLGTAGQETAARILDVDTSLDALAALLEHPQHSSEAPAR